MTETTPIQTTVDNLSLEWPIRVGPCVSVVKNTWTVRPQGTIAIGTGLS
jgi:hypothetical protein